MVTVSAVKYATARSNETIASKATFNLPPCTVEKTCPLTEIKLGDEFRGLSGIVFAAEVDGTPVPWFIDDIKMDWSDHSCAAGLLRIRSR
jgi:hypothetical protein